MNRVVHVGGLGEPAAGDSAQGRSVPRDQSLEGRVVVVFEEPREEFAVRPRVRARGQESGREDALHSGGGHGSS